MNASTLPAALVTFFVRPCGSHAEPVKVEAPCAKEAARLYVKRHVRRDEGFDKGGTGILFVLAEGDARHETRSFEYRHDYRGVLTLTGGRCPFTRKAS